jgi:hypothetical protein
VEFLIGAVSGIVFFVFGDLWLWMQVRGRWPSALIGEEREVSLREGYRPDVLIPRYLLLGAAWLSTLPSWGAPEKKAILFVALAMAFFGVYLVVAIRAFGRANQRP